MAAKAKKAKKKVAKKKAAKRKGPGGFGKTHATSA
jgi:hypothetical protein